jgi:hypothetical protein
MVLSCIVVFGCTAISSEDGGESDGDILSGTPRFLCSFQAGRLDNAG